MPASPIDPVSNVPPVLAALRLIQQGRNFDPDPGFQNFTKCLGATRRGQRCKLSRKRSSQIAQDLVAEFQTMPEISHDEGLYTSMKLSLEARHCRHHKKGFLEEFERWRKDRATKEVDELETARRTESPSLPNIADLSLYDPLPTNESDGAYDSSIMSRQTTREVDRLFERSS
jgi:hypothetical protein